VEDVSSTPQPTGSAEQNKQRLEVARMFHELISRDREDGRATGQPRDTAGLDPRRT
jgi:hypothetical protein